MDDMGQRYTPRELQSDGLSWTGLNMLQKLSIWLQNSTLVGCRRLFHNASVKIRFTAPALTVLQKLDERSWAREIRPCHTVHKNEHNCKNVL